ncbi:MAG: plasmid pRiA4b ORF-3 family protein [Deltaproteobacteria bacterium]|jgi:hypothetical protein|nr:plasmid pRiA4b ORF-3 family protein [Deltaproteobacteria bacterium]
MANKYYLLRVEMIDIKPKIWRRFFVPSSIRLSDLHEAIQLVMGWSDYHLYEFSFGKKTYYFNGTVLTDEVDDDLFSNDNPKPADPTLTQIGLSKGSSFRYIYDMGDTWRHQIKVINDDFSPPADRVSEVGCLDGELACPPEDCGSVPGYYDCVKAVKSSLNQDDDDDDDEADDEDQKETKSKDPNDDDEDIDDLDDDDDDDDFDDDDGDDDDLEKSELLEWLDGWRPDFFDLQEINGSLKGRFPLKKAVKPEGAPVKKAVKSEGASDQKAAKSADKPKGAPSTSPPKDAKSANKPKGKKGSK